MTPVASPPAVPEATPRDECRLQDGIYFRRATRPGRCYRLLLLEVAPQTELRRVGQAIAAVWAMVQDLRRGIVGDLKPTRPSDPTPTVDAGTLTCLLGLGAPLFDRYPTLHRPADVVRLNEGAFLSLPRVAVGDRRTGEADLALQFVAETDLAVDRAVVESWMLIKRQSLPLGVVTVHGGFSRDDDRSWLGFHDGIGNIALDLRQAALEATTKDPSWMFGGTYMAFLRLAVDLDAWRRLSRDQQEVLVGRDKLTGCPLEGLDAEMHPVPLRGCPLGGAGPDSTAYVNPPPPPVDQMLLRKSHIHRANPNRTDEDPDQNSRIFRQGFEFAEALEDGRLRLGLNFVSFQGNLQRVTNILRTTGWLGNVNFGGDPGTPFQLISLIAGGYYAVPPVATPFPGAEIFSPGAA